MKINASDALLIVDVQNDFCLGGALAVKEGDLVVPVLNRLIPLFTTVVLTSDWHPPDHCSFDPKPKFIDKSWPVHCVAETPGADFHPDLTIPERAWVIRKGQESDKECYSDFETTDLASRLHERGIRRVFIGGLATDYCVKASALDAVRLGFETFLIEDACRGVDIPPGTVEKALAEMAAVGIQFPLSDQIS